MTHILYFIVYVLHIDHFTYKSIIIIFSLPMQVALLYTFNIPSTCDNDGLWMYIDLPDIIIIVGAIILWLTNVYSTPLFVA